MPRVGSQVYLCDLPIRFDTYSGCTHACKYCFSQRKYDLNNIVKCESRLILADFIKGKRDKETTWCDWDIPLHWGGMSDPFQPIESKLRVSLECLKEFAETKYPVVISTKGRLVWDKEYLDLIKQCNAVIQISMVSPAYDKHEVGAPSFKERLSHLLEISQNCKRLIIRIQPYMVDVRNDVLDNLENYKKRGVYGVVVEGIKMLKQLKGFVRVGGDSVYPTSVLEIDFKLIKQRCHDLGLKFYVGENRLRHLGDSPTCCGVDGLVGFKPNTANLNNYYFKKRICGNKQVDIEYTEKMKQPCTALCFKSLKQDSVGARMIKQMAFKDCMELLKKDNGVKKVFGL